MRRNAALKLIAALALLLGSSASALAQGTPAATSAEKFNIRNLLGQTITLTGQPSGVTPYALTFPSAPPATNGQILSATTGGLLSWVTPASGNGTVTSFSAGNLSPLFTTGVATATTTPALSFSLNSQAQNTVFAAPTTIGGGAPTFRLLTTSDIPSGLPYVSSVAVGNLSPLFTTTNGGTVLAPSFTFAAVSQAQNLVYASPNGAAGNPTFRTLTGSDITGAALTKTDDANVTLTLGGSPTNALLNATSLTLGWTGNLSIARGGTGAGTAVAALNNLLPSQAGNAGEFLTTDGAGNVSWAVVSAGGGGTVTNFSAGDLSPLFTTSEATTTTTPALSFNLNTQSANTVFAGPVSGGATAPTFRALNPADIPAGSGHYIQNQTGLQSSSNFHISGNGQIEGTLGIKGTSTGFTNITGGAQGASTINYTLPTAQASTGGMVLTNDGSGALSWTDVNVANVQYAQNQFDDFIMSELDGGGASDHTEYSYVHDLTTVEADASGNDYFGRVICATTGTGSSADAWISSGGNLNKIRVGGKVILYETRVRLEDVNLGSQTQQSYTGFMNYTSGSSPSTGDPAAGIFFKHNDDISANWQVVTRNSSTSTTTTTTIAVTADQWYKLRFVVNAAGNSVEFYIDDVLVATHTTNIPTSTTGMRIVAKTEKTSGNTDMTFSTDWWLTKMIR